MQNNANDGMARCDVNEEYIGYCDSHNDVHDVPILQWGYLPD